MYQLTIVMWNFFLPNHGAKNFSYGVLDEQGDNAKFFQKIIRTLPKTIHYKEKYTDDLKEKNVTKKNKIKNAREYAISVVEIADLCNESSLKKFLYRTKVGNFQ